MARRNNGRTKIFFIISLVSILTVSSSLLALSGCKSKKNEDDNSQFTSSEIEEQNQQDHKEQQVQEPEPEPEPEPIPETADNVQTKPVISQPQPIPFQKASASAPFHKAPAPAPFYKAPSSPATITKNPEKQEKLKDMYYDEPGYYDSDMLIQSALVKSGGVHVQNKTVKGDFVVDNNITSGNVYLDNIVIEGNLIVNSPNLDNLFLNDVQCKNVIIKDAGKYFYMETSGKSNLDNLTTYDNIYIKEKNLHTKCSGFVNVFCEPNVDYVYTDITLDNTSLNTLNINTPTNVYSNNTISYINTLTAKRKADIKEGVKVRNLINYSVDTIYYHEPTHIDHRGNAADKYNDKYYSDKYSDIDSPSDKNDDKYYSKSNSKYLYEPNVSVSSVTNSWDLKVDIGDIDRRADYVTVKLYVDGIYQRSKKADICSGGYSSLTFEHVNDADLKGTSKEIRAYAVCSDNRYSDSAYAKWRSITPKSPAISQSISNDKNTLNVTLFNTDTSRFDYKYTYGTDETLISNRSFTIDISELAVGESISYSVKGYLKDTIIDGIYNKESDTSTIVYTKTTI